MSAVGVLLYVAGCLRLSWDGQQFGRYFRPWHPLTWILLVLAILPAIFLGEKITSLLPLQPPAPPRDRLLRRQWVSPWTAESSLISSGRGIDSGDTYPAL